MNDLPIFKKTVTHEIPLMKRETLAAFFSQLSRLKGKHDQISSNEYHFIGIPEVKSSFYGKFELQYAKNPYNLNAVLTITHRGMTRWFYFLFLVLGFIAQILVMYFNDLFTEIPFIPAAFILFELVGLSLMFYLNARRSVQQNMEYINEAIRKVTAPNTIVSDATVRHR